MNLRTLDTIIIMEILTPNISFVNMDFWVQDDLNVSKLSDLSLENCNVQGTIMDFIGV